MMFGWPRLWLWIGLLLVVAVMAGSVAFVFYSDSRDSAAALVSTLVSAVTAVAGGAAWLWKQAQSTGAARLPLERAADALAEQLRRQWERGAAERGLTYPAPIPVQWRWSDLQVTGPRAEVVEGPFAPLPGMAAVTIENLQSGELRDLLGVYGGIGSGRLVIVGEPGAGKSSAGIRLLRDALAHRASRPAEDRVPVPVLVTPHGWDSTAEPFADWLANRLARDYALLRAPEYGRNATVRLIEGGHLAVILDGLDEMPEELRSVALRALDEQATFRLVVLARSRELVTAVSGGAHLRGAAALELLPIDPRQAAEYLASCQIDPLPVPWQHVIDRLHEHPDGVVAQALNTPLMLTLVRDTYGSGERVDELLDGSRFATREAAEDHLLDRVLPAAYTRHPGQAVPPHTADQAQRWLAQLARRMNEAGTRDLTWWQIPRWTPAWPRAVVTVVVMSVVSAVLIASLAGLAAHMQLHTAQGAGPLTALAAVFGDTLGYVFIIGSGLLLRSSPSERSPQQQNQLRWSRTDTPTTLLTGLAVGLAYGLVSGLVSGPVSGFGFGFTRGLVIGLVYGLVFGLAAGLVLGLRQPPTEATSPLDPLSLWRQERQVGLGLVVGLVFGLTGGFVDGLLFGSPVGLVYGLTDGLVSGLGSGLVSSATWAAALASAQLWRRDETPVRLLRFLDDARERQILRTVGSAYQFRHARLQDRFAQGGLIDMARHADKSTGDGQG